MCFHILSYILSICVSNISKLTHMKADCYTNTTQKKVKSDKISQMFAYHSSWLACCVNQLLLLQMVTGAVCLFVWLLSILINPGNHVKMQEGTLGFFIASDAKEVKR